jgi:hypothetical protein
MSAGDGVAAELRWPVRQVYYALVMADTGFGSALRASWRAGAGVKAGVVMNQGIFRGLLEAKYISYGLGDTRPLWTGSAAVSAGLARDTALRAEYTWRGKVKEAGVYFHQFVFPP